MSDSTPGGTLFSIANLRSYEAERVTPWTDQRTRPELKSKAKYREWCENVGTNGVFFSGVEGLEAGRRVQKTQNEPYKIHAFVADYDFRDPTFNLQPRVAPDVYLPNWVSRTFSGGVRAVWLFEVPAPVVGPAQAGHFLAEVGKALNATQFYPGLDPCYTKPYQYYEKGTDWTHLSESVLPFTFVTDCWVKANRKTPAPNDAIDLSKVEEEVHNRFPGRWSGDFSVGARGVRFWAPDADAIAAVVCEEGMMAFTGEESFMPWERIFGRQWVQSQVNQGRSFAVMDHYFDGKAYWHRGEQGWADLNKEDMRLRLRAKYELRARLRRGEEVSPVDDTLYQIQDTRRVSAGFPFLYQAEDVVTVGVARYLNLSRVRVIPAIDAEITGWGDGFPLLAEYFDTLLPTDLPRVTLLAWMKRFYESAVAGDLLKGHVIYIAGPVGAGKTFFGHQILGRLMGASADASHHVNGQDQFNKELIETPVWLIDDAVAASDPNAHRRFTNFVKKTAANHNFTYRPMYSNPVTMPWNGRLVVTCNEDAESLQMLPFLDGSIEDKVMFFRVAEPTTDFMRLRENLGRELPAFGRWLLQWEYPAEILPEKASDRARWGVKVYQEKSLLETAREASPTAGFREVLDLWRHSYFTDNRQADYWEGGVGELALMVLSDDVVAKVAQDFKNTRKTGTFLGLLVHENIDWIEKLKPQRGSTRWRILRGEIES